MVIWGHQQKVYDFLHVVCTNHVPNTQYSKISLITSAKADVMQSVQFVNVSFCLWAGLLKK